jgi:hypothetical protein
MYDSVLSECLTFYKGAPNVGTFFPSGSFVELSGDVTKLDEDIKLITDVIMSDGYESRVADIKEAKNRVLTQYAFEPRVMSIIEMSYALCFASAEPVLQHLSAEGFKKIHQVGLPVPIVDILQTIRRHDVPAVVMISPTVYENVYDRLCFSFSAEPQADMYVFELNLQMGILDACIMPNGANKMLQNIAAQRDLFVGLKLHMIRK